jgi:hypothetical protein
VAITDTGYIAGTMNLGDFLTFGCIFRGATNSAIQIPFTTGVDNAGNLLGIADPIGGMVVGLLPPTRGHHLQLRSPLSRFYATNSHGVIVGSAAAVTDDSLDTTTDPPRACCCSSPQRLRSRGRRIQPRERFHPCVYLHRRLNSGIVHRIRDF